MPNMGKAELQKVKDSMDRCKVIRLPAVNKKAPRNESLFNSQSIINLNECKFKCCNIDFKCLYEKY